jgi:glutathione S-transferase
MILIGQYDSPFVRRVGIALTLYGIAFEHRPWSVFNDAAKVQALNPLMRVPTLVLDDGFVLTDSHMMLDYLDSTVPEDVAMFPRSEPARHIALKRATLGTGLAEKAVSLFYERRLHDTVSPVWEARCRSQIAAVLTALEAERSACPGPWFGSALGHDDIAVACAIRFVTEALPGVADLSGCPGLRSLCNRLEATAAFLSVYQPFLPPA